MALFEVMGCCVEMMGKLLADGSLLSSSKRAEYLIAACPPEAGHLGLKPIACKPPQLRTTGLKKFPRECDFLLYGLVPHWPLPHSFSDRYWGLWLGARGKRVRLRSLGAHIGVYEIVARCFLVLFSVAL